MIRRYHAVLMSWCGRDGYWRPSTLGKYRTAERASRRLARVVRGYTRYERHVDFGEVYDVKSGLSQGSPLTVYLVPTVGDRGVW